MNDWNMDDGIQALPTHEEWDEARYARDRACGRIDLHTQVDRADTRRFYERCGWDQGARVYKKEL